MIALPSVKVYLSLLPICAAQEYFLTCVREFPIFHPAALDFEDVKVKMNVSRLGWDWDAFVYYKISGLQNYIEHADALPICFSAKITPEPGCVSLSYKTLVADCPRGNKDKKEDVWFFSFISVADETLHTQLATTKKRPLYEVPDCLPQWKAIIHESISEGLIVKQDYSR